MKRATLQKKIKISNAILFHIYTQIDTDINMDELAQEFGISKFYMHKIFKEIFGRNIYESIKSIRLQKSSNLLITNKYSTISEVAYSCGYSSQSSFIRLFKKRFSMTPKAWRQGGYKAYSQTILQQSNKAIASKASFDHIEPSIVKMPEMHAYYIRHQGYNPQIKQTWEKIQTWIFTQDIQHYTQVALFHDNPTITPLSECQYVACVINDEGKEITDERLPKFKIADGIYAKFHLRGVHGDLLKFIHWVYHEWLPQSDYETTTKPPYVVYQKNNYLSEDNGFEINFYLSIIF